MTGFQLSNDNAAIFFVKLPPLQYLCHVVLKTDKTLSKVFQGQVLKCRQLLFLNRDVIASPHFLDRSLIDVIMSVEYFRDKKFIPVCKKLGLQLMQATLARPCTLQSCFAYTLKFRISYVWNQIDNLLIKGSDCITSRGKLEAVDMDIVVSDEQLTATVKPFLVRNPPPSLDNFDICLQAMHQFEQEDNSTIEDFSIYRSWCYVLPSMKRGQLVRVSHKIPVEKHPNATQPPFTDYAGLKKYWKNHYGIRLPESEEGMVYCSIYFKLIGPQLFTYPLCCLRTRPIQIMPRCDSGAIIKEFMSCFQQKMDKMCGFKLVYSSKPCYATNKVMEAVQIKPERLQNVTTNIADVNHNTVPIPSRPVSSQIQSTKDANKDIIPSSQAIEAFQVLKEKVENEYPSSQVILSSQMGENGAKHAKTIMKALPKNANGKYIPVFTRKKQPVILSSGNECGKMIDNNLSAKIRNRKAFNKALLNETTPRKKTGESAVNRSSSTIGLAASRAASGRFKTPSQIPANSFDSGYDSNETPASMKRKGSSDVTLKRRYLPKKLSFGHKSPDSPLKIMKNHSFDKLFSKAGSNNLRDERQENKENSKDGIGPGPSSPLKIIKNHSFDKLFARAGSFNNVTTRETVNSRSPLKVMETHDFDKLFQAASRGCERVKGQKTDDNAILNADRPPCRMPVSKERSFDELFATARSFQDTINMTLPSFAKKGAVVTTNSTMAKKLSFDEVFKSASVENQDILSNPTSQSQNYGMMFSKVASVNEVQPGGHTTCVPPQNTGNIQEDSRNMKIAKRKMYVASPDLAKRMKIKAEISVEDMARANMLFKVNAPTLISWLKSKGISARSREKKDDLMTKVKVHLHFKNCDIK